MANIAFVLLKQLFAAFGGVGQSSVVIKIRTPDRLHGFQISVNVFDVFRIIGVVLDEPVSGYDRHLRVSADTGHHNGRSPVGVKHIFRLL